jgi:hypothetical protein
MLFTQQNRVEMQARKLFTYHGLNSTLCNHMESPLVARLQREEMSTTQQEARETGTFSTGMYGAVHPLCHGIICKIQRHTNLLEVLHLCKHTATAW